MLAGSLVVCAPDLAQSGSAPMTSPRPDSVLRACSAPAKMAFSLEALHEPVDVQMNFTLAEIVGLAEQSGWVGNHTPVGFSIAKTGYSVSLAVDAAAEAACSEPIQVSVIVRLMHRHIEVAKDLASDPGCMAAARHHYILQAASTDVTLTHFAEELSLVLSQRTLPNLQHDPARTDEDRARIDQVTRTAIDRVRPFLAVAVRAAAQGIDTPDEVGGLAQACPSATGAAPGLQTGITL